MGPREILLLLFKTIARMSRDGLISGSHKSYLKDCTIKHDPVVIAAALAYMTTNDLAEFEDTLRDILETAVYNQRIPLEMSSSESSHSDLWLYANC